MYDWLPEVCREIRGNLLEIYWLSIVPLTLLLIILEFFKLPEREPNALGVIKRAAISIILLMSFDEVIHTIAAIGDGIVLSISPKPHINQVLDEVWKFVQSVELSWLKYKETIIWVFSLMSFIFAYLGAFIADALVHFCWAILYILSPLMILAYIPQSTAKIAIGLYRSLCTVMTWKVMWAVLGVILLKFTTNVPITEADNYNAVLLIVINVFIGLSMLFVPIATKAFLSGDFAAYSGALAIAPAIASKKLIVSQLKKAGGFAAKRGKNFAFSGVRGTGRAVKGFGERFKGRKDASNQRPNYSDLNTKTKSVRTPKKSNTNKGDRRK